MDWRNKNPKSPKGKEDVTPEERLFRIISGDASREDSDFSQDEEIVEHGLIAKFENWSQKLQDFFKQWPAGRAGRRETYRMWDSRSALQALPLAQILQIQKMNQVLLVGVVLLALYMIVDVAFVKITQWVPGLSNEAVQAPSILSFQAPVRADLERYLQGAARRNLFQPGAVPVPAGEAPPEPAAAPAVPAAPPDFKLLGISWDASGYVAMIQADPNQEGALFVRKGDKVKGFVIDEVRDSAVKFSQGGQTYELN